MVAWARVVLLKIMRNDWIPDYSEGRADKICRFVDGFLVRCEEHEESDDFRSKQPIVTIYRNVEVSLQDKFGR